MDVVSSIALRHAVTIRTFLFVSQSARKAAPSPCNASKAVIPRHRTWRDVHCMTCRLSLLFA